MVLTSKANARALSASTSAWMLKCDFSLALSALSLSMLWTIVGILLTAAPPAAMACAAAAFDAPGVRAGLAKIAFALRSSSYR